MSGELAPPRTFPGRRWVMTGLRALHLVGGRSRILCSTRPCDLPEN
ncbi:MAG: hypothetical protein ACNA8J_07000 [Gammaproteobacteria bacterium]